MAGARPRRPLVSHQPPFPRSSVDSCGYYTVPRGSSRIRAASVPGGPPTARPRLRLKCCQCPKHAVAELSTVHSKFRRRRRQ